MSDRFTRFVKNAGGAGIIQILIMGIFFFFVLRKEIGSGQWLYTVPMMLIAFFATYPARNILVDHVGVTRVVMNALVVGTFVLLFVAMPEGERSRGRDLAIMAGVGLYMGAYFWLLSDERIGTQ
jgi:hypothetical protein